MNNSSMIKPALIGGMALGILSALPIIEAFNCVCCAWAIIGGILAASICVRDSPVLVTLGRGAGLGFISGLIGAVVNLLFSIPMYFLFNRGNSADVSKYMQELLSKIPDVPMEVQQTIEELATRSDLGTMLLVFGFISNLIMFPLFAMIGGAIGVAIFEKRKPGNPPPYTTPPPIAME